MPRGRFVTFEGLDGTGKSTQLEKLASELRRRGLEVVTTREPGGTEIGEQVRGIVLDSRTSGLAAKAELALMFAARAQLIEELVKPSLERGAWVLCDRFTDSSEAYQGGGRQMGSEAVLRMHRVVCGDFWPDLTILMDSNVEKSVARARRRNTSQAGADENRFETENREFFQRVHQAYLALARREERVVTIDARRPISVVHREIVTAVEKRLLPKKSSAVSR
jgi:dTMP kinase